jgi:hypothetical protein
MTGAPQSCMTGDLHAFTKTPPRGIAASSILSLKRYSHNSISRLDIEMRRVKGALRGLDLTLLGVKGRVT